MKEAARKAKIEFVKSWIDSYDHAIKEYEKIERWSEIEVMQTYCNILNEYLTFLGYGDEKPKTWDEEQE